MWQWISYAFRKGDSSVVAYATHYSRVTTDTILKQASGSSTSEAKKSIQCSFAFSIVKVFVHAEVVSSGQIVIQKLYLEVLKRLRESIRRRRADLWRIGDWFFHHDKALLHTDVSVLQFLTTTTRQQISTPLLTGYRRCDFFLFNRLRTRGESVSPPWRR